MSSLNQPLKKTTHQFNIRLLSMITFFICAGVQAQHAAPKTDVLGLNNSKYVDNVMTLPPIDNEALQLKLDTFDENGWSRGWRIESSKGTQRGLTTTQNNALSINGFIETPDYGIFSVNANYSSASQETDGLALKNSGSTWRIDQRGLALDGGWLANHSIGNVSTIGVPLSRGLSRTVLPFAPIRGVSGQWSVNDLIDLNAAVGETGTFVGFDLSGFKPAGGNVVSAGAQLRTGEKSFAAAQAIQVKNQVLDFQTDRKQSTQGFYTAASVEGRLPWADEEYERQTAQNVSDRIGGFRVQGNLLHSTQSLDGNSLGAWADAQWRTERWRHSAGVFHFGPRLRWGEALLASNLQGLYWRADIAARQWQFSGTSEFSNTVVGNNAPSAFFSGSARYQMDSRNALNANINLRRLTNPASSVNVSWSQKNVWGQTQWLGEVTNVNTMRTTRLGVDHSLALSTGSSLSASLAWDKTDSSFGDNHHGRTWGLLGSLSPASGLVLDGALRGSRYNDGAHALDANVALTWQLTQGWSTALRYTESRGQLPSANIVASALTTALLPPVIPISSFRSVMLTLRYEGRAGSSSRPIGGNIGEGAGTIGGTVYFDADSNGQRGASETGVPGVVVTLDRRYVTRTDAQGNYEFAYVSAKPHAIEVSADNVPLPWSPVNRESIVVDVGVRSLTVQNFAVQRDR